MANEAIPPSPGALDVQANDGQVLLIVDGGITLVEMARDRHGAIVLSPRSARHLAISLLLAAHEIEEAPR